MTKIEKKQIRKSKAAQQAENYMINKYIKSLEADLRAANIKTEQLEKELSNIKKELKSTRAELKRSKASNKELRARTGQLIQNFNAKIKKVNRTSSPKIQATTDNKIQRDKFGNVFVRVAERARRTKSEWLNENKANFIRQFMERLKQDFPQADATKMQKLQQTLQSLDADSIDAVLLGVDESFRQQYYESDALATYIGRGKEEFLDSLFQAFGI